MCVEVEFIAKGHGLQDHELVLLFTPRRELELIELGRFDTHIFIFPQGVGFNASKWVDDKRVLKERGFCVYACVGAPGVVKRKAEVLIQFTKPLIVPGQADEQLFGAFSKIYTYYWLNPMLRTQPDKVQAGRSAIDVC